MTTSMFVVVPASPDDLSSIASLQYQACMSDPGFNAIFGGPPTSASLAHLTKQYEDMMENDSTAYVMVAKDAMRGGIVSYAIWHFLPAKSAEVVEQEMLADIDRSAFPPTANVELGQRLIKNSNKKRHEILSECFGMGTPYAYLAAIGTNPQYQKQGAASKLVEWVVDRIDDRNLPAYVESSPAAQALYQKFGFREYDRLVLDLEPVLPGDFANTCMIRFPNAA